MTTKDQPAPASARPLRIGIIGCGHWGKNYVRTFSSLPGTTLTAVADLSADKLATVTRSAQGPTTRG